MKLAVLKYSFLTAVIFTCSLVARAQVDINAMEYFIDTDPGVGLGVAVPVTTGAIIAETFIVPTSALLPGFHTVYFRVQDLNNVWSISESRSFFISTADLTAIANLGRVEYFIDTDPGYGNGISLPFAIATTADFSDIIPTATLLSGFHTLYVRAQDADLTWGNVESRSFYVSNSNLTVIADITEVEYYIDVDPGHGSGTALPIVAATNLDFTTTVITSALPAGHHTIYVRILDSDGVWSEVESRSFYIDAFTSGKIAGIEYFFNTDPGYGSGTTLPILPVKDSIDSVVSIPTVPLTAGSHVMGLRIVNDNGTIGMTDYFNITLCDGATADFIGDNVCIGSATTFTDGSLNVLAGDSVKWDFENDGIYDLKYITAGASAGNQTFTYPSPGIYTAKLLLDRAGCISIDSIQVSVEALPVANAGLDQAICTTNTVLAAKPANTNESGLWSIYRGSALITNTLDSLSTLTSITTDSVELIWTVTNTLGGCNVTDTLLIMANLPITASLLSGTVDIGQIINVDVQSPATINAGDNLTTSISTIPLYGLASILANGTIDYEPDPDALTKDSLIYRITNQCNNFAENQINFTIINAPPVIDTVTINQTAVTTEITVDLTGIISDPNNNIDFTTITIVSQPLSGAIATIDASGVLTLDYRGITFSGTDELQIRVCDLVGVCTVETITIGNIEVGGINPPIAVFNGVSPNGDGFNDFLEIENIEFYPNNVVVIINRWGAEIARYQGYNNQDIVFKEANLPSGTYYYHILSGVDGVEEVTGHFVLKID